MHPSFVDRKEELQGLNEVYEQKGSDLFVIYGRRRIGKTTLVKKFVENKPSFYFLAKHQDFSLELERIQKKFSREFDVYLSEPKGLEDLFREMVKKVTVEKKFVFTIDEFQYWIEERKEILSDIQHLWDEFLQHENVFLILTGSSVGMIESEVLNYKSPVYGRRSRQLKLEEMPIASLQQFLPKYSFKDILRTYGAVSAIPFYLKEFDPAQSFFENISATFLNKLNILYEEAENLLREELRKPNTYFNIVKAIIDGTTKLSEIASKSRVSITNINKYLKVLERLNIIKRIYPITAPSKKKNFLYKIQDNYFRFWLSYVYPYQAQIEEQPSEVLNLIKREYNQYMAPVFEEICRKASMRQGVYEQVGKWWYKGEEIDVVALNGETKTIALGECKWSKKKVDMRTLHDLKNKAEKVRWNQRERNEEYLLFSKNGFTNDLLTITKQEPHISLFDLETLEDTFTIPSN